MGTSLVDTAVAEGVEQHDSDRVPAVGDGPDTRNCFRAYRLRSVCHTNVGCLRDNKKANHGCLHPRSCSAVVHLCRQHCFIRRGVDSTRERPAACRSRPSRRISRDAFQKTTSCLRWRLESGHARTPPCCLSCAPSIGWSAPSIFQYIWRIIATDTGAVLSVISRANDTAAAMSSSGACSDRTSPALRASCASKIRPENDHSSARLMPTTRGKNQLEQASGTMPLRLNT
jgi:hypothetical protein